MGKILNPATGKPFAQVRPWSQLVSLREQIVRTLKGKYDAAQTTSQNELHWIQADELSPHAANSLAVRKKARSRSRYETANNGYLQGIILSLCGDMVGGGPTLQITDPRFTDKQQEAIERRWLERSKKTKLRRKLWQLRRAKAVDGEGFSVFVSDRRLRHPVKVVPKIYECDQFSHYKLEASTRKKTNLEIDGIRFSAVTGEPTQYHLLNEHPGETLLYSLRPQGGQWISANNVIHWFRRDRAWLRGIPETMPTLPLWALLRRYTLAVVQNAEIAADFTVLLKSLQPASTTPFPLDGSGEPTEEDPNDWFSSFPVDRGLMTVLPSLYDLEQLDPKQPVTMYDTFVNALVQEASRPLLTPRNQALGNSGGYNMASGTLDRQLYRTAIDQERYDCNDEVLDEDLDQWWFEAVRTSRYFEEVPQASEDEIQSIEEVINQYPSLREEPPQHVYRWDEVSEHTDPVKVAQAIDILHKGRHISDTDIQEGRFNRRVEDHYRNLEKQYEFRGDPLELAQNMQEMASEDPPEDQD